MKKLNSFTLFLLSTFSLLLFTQAKWMYERDVYDHIAARFVLVVLLTIPIGFIITLILSPLISIFKRGEASVKVLMDLSRSMLVLLLSLIPLYERDFIINDPTMVLMVSLIPATIINIYLKRDDFFKKEINGLSYKRTLGYCLRWYWIEVALFLKKFSNISHKKLFNFSFTIYPLARFILLFQTIVVVKFSIAAAGSFVEFALIMLSTIITTILCVDIIMSISPKPIRMILSIFIAFIYSFLSTYHYAQSTSLDFALLITNLDLIFYSESMTVAGDNLSPWLKNTVYLFFALAIICQFLFGLFSPKIHGVRKKRHFFIKSGVYLLLVFLIPINADELSDFINSAKVYQKGKKDIERVKKTLSKEFPYVKDSLPDYWKTNDSIKPNVIIVALESFNGLMVNEYTPEGVEITPFINSLKDRGLMIENYYGNSIQTSRGLLSIYGGILPSYRNKIMVEHSDLNLKSIPKILREENYSTFFIKAFKSLSFDNNGPFMEHIGFEHVMSMTPERTAHIDKKYIWGWGLQDDIYYKECFNIIDSVHEASGDSIRKPFLLSLITVSNHMKFNHLPDDKKLVYPNSKNSEHLKNITNSMHLTDLFLKGLFDLLEQRKILENTIVVVTGDHSFPRGDFGTYNQYGFYEENFRTPLAIIWKDHIKPQFIKDVAYSHIDIAPTLMDLLNIDTKNHFIGESIFSPNERKPVLLSQPYDGLYLSSVKYPYKYAKSMGSNKEYLFDISKIDGERLNLIKDKAMTSIAEELKSCLNNYYVNQTLVEYNRIWPVDSSSNFTMSYK